VEWIEGEGWAATGGKINPGLRLALDLLTFGLADALVVSTIDRLARSALNVRRHHAGFAVARAGRSRHSRRKDL
jgi:DNA invertase Pin-like site-specific DNA recombinase